MLNEILSKNTCADCKTCCFFLETERFDMPAITDKLISILAQKNLKAEYEYYKSKRIFKHEPVYIDGEQLLRCPMLDKTGCMLGDDKPFECKIWPFRPQKLDGSIAVTVSPICESVFKTSLLELYNFYNEKLQDTITDAIRGGDIILTDYSENYPIIGVIGRI